MRAFPYRVRLSITTPRYRCGVFISILNAKTMSEKKEIHLPLHAIKLSGGSEFSQKFNAVSDLFAKAMDESLPEEEQKKWFEQYWQAKYCLEMGIG